MMKGKPYVALSISTVRITFHYSSLFVHVLTIGSREEVDFDLCVRVPPFVICL